MALVIYLRYITMPDLKSYKKYNASAFFLELKFVCIGKHRNINNQS